ncbi:MAG: radical SAM family heme chaperone HemW [Polyangiaceae bacterium]|nr:radical SAM family heme chaperone HemW [Polyangiaceae bacterium]
MNYDVGVYVHFPFCLRRCTYCDFATWAVRESDIPHDAYADAVLTEAAKRLSLAEGRIRLASVFFGGGTPSLWKASAVGRIVRGLGRLVSEQVEELEVTVEANPCRLDVRRVGELQAEGVTRLSVGVQSTDDTRLRMLGRVHDARAGLEALRVARASGVKAVSADLMHGLPGENALHAVGEARRIVDEGVDHLSAYLLALEPGTVLHEQVQRGHLASVDDEQSAMSYVAVSDSMVDAGFAHYEVSNFARPGCACEHNARVWRGEPYLGLGVAAVGCMPVSGVGMVRTRNLLMVGAYERAVRELAPSELVHTGPGVADVEVLDGEMRMRERIMLGLRTARGVDLQEESRALGVAGWTRDRQRQAVRLAQAGRLVVRGARVLIPRRQWLWESDTVARLL